MGHTTYSCYQLDGGIRDFFARSQLSGIFKMPDLNSDRFCESANREIDFIEQQSVSQEDLLMEQIIENISSTPLGQVLKKIASLPEIRQEKVLEMRRQLTDGRYELNERFDMALEKVLDELGGK